MEADVVDLERGVFLCRCNSSMFERVKARFMYRCVTFNDNFSSHPRWEPSIFETIVDLVDDS
jgi:hypothetical protein